MQPNTETLTKLSIDLNTIVEKANKNFINFTYNSNEDKKKDEPQIMLLSNRAKKPPINSKKFILIIY